MSATSENLARALSSGQFTAEEQKVIIWQFGDLPNGWNCMFFNLCCKADKENLKALEVGFPQRVAAFRAWQNGSLNERLKPFEVEM